MSIEDAISLLEHYVASGQILDTPESLRFYNGDRESAVKLGIEALKVIKEFRTGKYKTINSPLVGEN